MRDGPNVVIAREAQAERSFSTWLTNEGQQHAAVLRVIMHIDEFRKSLLVWLLEHNRNETVGKKIREAEMNKFPYMLIVGEQEERDGSVSVRKHGEGDQGSMPVEDFAKLIEAEVRSTIKEF